MIQLKEVTKIYKTKRSRETPNKTAAIKNLDMSIDKGDVVGYLGVNGAGKSTTIKLLTGVLIPSTGHIEVLGLNPYKYRKQNAYNIGAVFGQRSQLIWDLPPLDTYNLLSKIYEVDNALYKKRLGYLVSSLALDSLIRIPVRNLSLGQRICCEIVSSLLHDPKILFLDEPTIGLDLINKERIIEFIKEINLTSNTTIFLTTHDINDVEKICKHIIIIDKGKKIYDGSINKILQEYGYNSTIKIRTNSIDKEKISLKYNYILDDNGITLTFDKRNQSATDILKDISNSNITIEDISISDTDLEKIVKSIYVSGVNRC